MAGKEFNIGISGDAIEKLRQIAGEFERVDDSAEELADELYEVKKALNAVNQENAQLKTQISTFNKFKEGIEGIAEGVKKYAESQKTTTKAFADSMKASDKTTARLESSIERIAKQTSVAAQNAKQMAKNLQIAETVYLDMENKLSKRQQGLLNKQLKNFEEGKIDTNTFLSRSKKISVDYTRAYAARLEKSSMTAAARKAMQDEYKHEQKMYDLESKGAEKRAKADAVHSKAAIEDFKNARIGEQQVEQEKEKTRQRKLQTEEYEKQQKYRTQRDEFVAGKAYYQGKKAQDQYQAYLEQADAAELSRQQKLDKNEQARFVLRERMNAMYNDMYDQEDKQAQKLMRATQRLRDTAVNISNFAATKGYKGTVGATATSELRTQDFYKDVMDYALGWKRTNSEAGKAADTLGRMIVDAKSLQSGINRIHTAFGQLASTVSAVRGVATELRKTLTSMVQPILNIVSQVSSAAFRSSLEALKNLELSEIGFGNFYGQSAVAGIMGDIKQEALLSPLSAAQLASYVNQIAPLSKGNSQLAIDATMGVAKMIQYSGGEVSTEMEYVIKNLRDVIAKGKALTIDIRQFNRAMPALTKVLEEMGESDLVKNGELTIDEEHAPKLLEAFQKVNEYGDVATIFEKTSETISGLMERVEEQVQFLLVDVGEFSGLTKLIKDTISDFLNDSNGLLKNIKMTAEFIGRDVSVA